MSAPTVRPEPAPSARGESRAQLKLAVPIALGVLLSMGMSVTDTLMVARFGAEALTGIALASDVYSIVLYLGSGTVAGLAPFLSRSIAARDHRAVVAQLRAGLRLVALLVPILSSLLWVSPALLERIGIDAAPSALGGEYLRCMAFMLVPMLVVALCRTCLNAMERPRVFLGVTLAALPLNALLNLAFMYGIGGVGAHGAIGTAYASVTVATLTAVALVIAVRRALPHDARVRPTRACRGGRVRDIVRVGLPIGVSSLGEVGLFLLSTLYIATQGSVDAAAHILVLRIAGLVYAVPLALSQAATVRTARVLGDAAAERVAARAAMALALGGGVLVCVPLGAAAPLVPGLLFDDSVAGLASAEIAITLIALLAVLEAFEIAGHGAAGVLRAHEDTRAPMVFSLVGYWLVAAPLGVWLVERHGLGAIGLWLALLGGTVFSCLCVLARLVVRPSGGRPSLADAGSMADERAMTGAPA